MAESGGDTNCSAARMEMPIERNAEDEDGAPSQLGVLEDGRDHRGRDPPQPVRAHPDHGQQVRAQLGVRDLEDRPAEGREPRDREAAEEVAGDALDAGRRPKHLEAGDEDDVLEEIKDDARDAWEVPAAEALEADRDHEEQRTSKSSSRSPLAPVEPRPRQHVIWSASSSTGQQELPGGTGAGFTPLRR